MIVKKYQQVLKWLKTTGAPEQPVPKNIAPVVANGTGGDNVVHEESLLAAENYSSPVRDWS